MEHPGGISAVIPTSRMILFRADADAVVVALKPYGQLILGRTRMGPHTLRVDPARDFATTLTEVQAILHPLAERAHGQ